MVKKHWLTADKAASLQFPSAELAKTAKVKTQGGDCIGPVFFICQAVKAELTQKGFDEARQAAGGYRVYTTIDQTAENAARDAVKAHNGNYLTVRHRQGPRKRARLGATGRRCNPRDVRRRRRLPDYPTARTRART